MSSENFNNELLLISVKPQYARKIFSGEKTVELRKSAPRKANKDSLLLIYVTSPVKELWGVCKIDEIISNNPMDLWDEIGDKTGISKKEYRAYYKESNNAYGIKLKDVIDFLESPIKLDLLKDLIPGFAPPQTYRYIDKNIMNLI
jgi:predicted transcriptional regulator